MKILIIQKRNYQKRLLMRFERLLNKQVENLNLQCLKKKLNKFRKKRKKTRRRNEKSLLHHLMIMTGDLNVDYYYLLIFVYLCVLIKK